MVFQRAESLAAVAALIGVPFQCDRAKERLVTLRGAALGSHHIRAKADWLTLGVIAAEGLGHHLLADAVECLLEAALQIQRSADLLPRRDFDGEGEPGFPIL